MKLFIAIAVLLALLAFSQAQDYSNQPEPSDPETAPSDTEVESSDLEAPSSDRQRPTRPDGWGRPHRLGRPDRRPLGHRISRPRPNEDQLSDNENPESNRPQGLPPRRPVFFDIKFDLGKENKIGDHPDTVSA